MEGQNFIVRDWLKFWFCLVHDSDPSGSLLFFTSTLAHDSAHRQTWHYDEIFGTTPRGGLNLVHQTRLMTRPPSTVILWQVEWRPRHSTCEWHYPKGWSQSCAPDKAYHTTSFYCDIMTSKVEAKALDRWMHIVFCLGDGLNRTLVSSFLWLRHSLG